MNQSKSEKISGKLRILVAPLDWGLGHATRCVPVIRQLIRQDFEVIIAAEGAQQQLLSAEFPALTILPLPGYRVKYARTAAGLFWKILAQAPRLKRIIKQENRWLKQIAEQYKIDAVISDNRYGLYHSSIPCIFMTHQLTIKTALGKWAERIIQKMNYKYIGRFSSCWVPDDPFPTDLSGALSHPLIPPSLPVRYIGCLSRLHPTQSTHIPHHLLIILSGPEPQRSLLEDTIIDQLVSYNGTATVVRGLPGEKTLIPSTNSIQFYNHLSAGELAAEMTKADFVISRSGYSTIMDVAVMRKKSIMIPTPGQTEQEYLAAYLKQKGWIYSIAQHAFSLSKAITAAADFNYVAFPLYTSRLLEQTISDLANQLSRD